MPTCYRLLPRSLDKVNSKKRKTEAAGYMKETQHDAVMERVDDQGRVIGFSVMGVSRFKKDKPLEAELAALSAPQVVREKRGKQYGK
jgi:ribosomal protein S11